MRVCRGQAAERLQVALLAAMICGVVSFVMPPSQSRMLRTPCSRRTGAASAPCGAPPMRSLLPRLRAGVTSLAAASGKGGKVRVPYREGGGGPSDTPEAKAYLDELRRKAASSVPATAVVTSKDAGGATLEIGVDEIRRKVEEAQRDVIKGDSTLEEFISDFNERAPEKDVQLEGRIPPEWLDVDFSCCLGKGGYGDVFEATITDGPLKGSKAVAKRAYARKNKLLWTGQPSLSATHSLTTLAGTVAARASSISTTSGSGSSSDADAGNAEEYLEVEDYVNRHAFANVLLVAPRGATCLPSAVSVLQGADV